jgi:hypothetical protein
LPSNALDSCYLLQNVQIDVVFHRHKECPMRID